MVKLGMVYDIALPTLPSGQRLHNYGKSPFSMGKSTISMAIFKFANCLFTRGYSNSNENRLAALGSTRIRLAEAPAARAARATTVLLPSPKWL